MFRNDKASRIQMQDFIKGKLDSTVTITNPKHSPTIEHVTEKVENAQNKANKQTNKK